MSVENLHKRMLSSPAEIELATSWSPAGRASDRTTEAGWFGEWELGKYTALTPEDYCSSKYVRQEPSNTVHVLAGHIKSPCGRPRHHHIVEEQQLADRTACCYILDAWDTRNSDQTFRNRLHMKLYLISILMTHETGINTGIDQRHEQTHK